MCVITSPFSSCSPGSPPFCSEPFIAGESFVTSTMTAPNLRSAGALTSPSSFTCSSPWGLEASTRRAFSGTYASCINAKSASDPIVVFMIVLRSSHRFLSRRRSNGQGQRGHAAAILPQPRGFFYRVKHGVQGQGAAREKTWEASSHSCLSPEEGGTRAERKLGDWTQRQAGPNRCFAAMQQGV